MSKPHLDSHVLRPLLMLSAALQFVVMKFTIKLMGLFFRLGTLHFIDFSVVWMKVPLSWYGVSFHSCWASFVNSS